MEVVLDRVSKAYGRQIVVREMSVTVRQGEMLALLGPSGCGKTTSLRMVAGFVGPSRGRILIGGRDMTPVPPHRRDTGLVFQNYALFPHMSVAENVAFGLRRRGAGRAEVAERVRIMIAMMRLDGLENRLPKELSGGQQQRVAVARALVINPSVLLLDEPFSNLDAKLRESTGFELRRIQKELGLTSIFVTHDQQEAMAIADRVAVMNNGGVEQIGSAREIYDRPATRFVAEFVGRANFLSAHVVASEASRLVVRCAGETFELGPQPSYLSGASGTLMVRPENVELRHAPEDAAAGTVESLTFQGSLAHVAVRLPTSERVIAEVYGRDHDKWLPDTRVRFSLAGTPVFYPVG